MSDKISYKAFSASIKAKYPEYSEVDDLELSTKMIEKYPEYADRVTLTDNSDFLPGGKMSMVQPSPTTPLRDQTNFLSSKAGDNADGVDNKITEGDKMRLGSFPVQAPTLNLEDKPAGQFYKPLPRQTSLYNPRLRENDMTGLTEEKTADTRPALQKEFIAPTGEGIKQGHGAQAEASEQSAEYLANPQEQAQAQWELLNSTPQKYGTPRKDQFGNVSWDLTADDQEYMNSLFDQLPEWLQVEEWKKNPEKWDNRPHIQALKTAGDNEQSIFGDNWLGNASLNAGDYVQSLNSGAAGLLGGVSELMHQKFEKPLWGWMSKDPNSRQIWGRIADFFFEDQAASQSLATSAQDLTFDETGQPRQKRVFDYAAEGDIAGLVDDLVNSGLQSAPTSIVAMGAGYMGMPSVGMTIIGASSYGQRKRELDQQYPDMPEWKKDMIAVPSAAVEVLSERLGSIQIGKTLAKIYGKAGYETAEITMKNTAEAIIDNTVKNLKNPTILKMVGKSMYEEGIKEELPASLGNYAIDVAAGLRQYDTKTMLLEGAESAIYGGFSGGVFGLIGAPGINKNKKIAKQLEGLKTEYDKANSNMQAAFADSEFEFDGEKIITLPLAQQEQILSSALQAENLTPEQKAAIQQYMQVGNSLNAALVNVGLTNIELLRKKANAFKEVQESINDKTGKLDVITIQGTADTQQYNVKSGTVAIDNEGKVDAQNSDEAIYYYTGAINEDGTPEVNIIIPESISALQSSDPKQLLQQSFMEIEAEEFTRSEFGEGMQVQLNTNVGKVPGTVVAVTPTGLVVNAQGQEMEIPFVQAVQDVEAVEQQQQQITESQAAPTYEVGSRVTAEGQTYVVAGQDEAGNYLINDENGQPLDRFTPAEMQEIGFVAAVNPTQVEQISTTDNGQQTTEETAPAQPKYPINAKTGEVDFAQFTPEHHYQYAVETEGETVAQQDLRNAIKDQFNIITKHKKKIDSASFEKKAPLRAQLKPMQEKLDVLNALAEKYIPQAQPKPVAKRTTSEGTASATIAERWENAPKTVGFDDTLTLPNGEVINGRWVLSTAFAPTPSHNPETYQSSEGFPTTPEGKNVNDNDYTNKRAEVETKAADYDSRAIDDPIVVSGGVVVSGNNRTMSGQIAAKNGTDTKYVEALKTKAKKYGFTTEQVEATENPRIYFEVTDQLPLNVDTFAKFNARTSKSKSATEKAIVATKRNDAELTGKIMATIEGFDSLADFYTSEKAQTEVLKYLLESGVINQNEVPELFEANNFTSNGRNYLEAIIIGNVMQEEQIKVLNLDGMKQYRAKIVRAIVPLLQNSKLSESLIPELNQAIIYLYESGGSLLDYFSQQNMFAENNFNKDAVLLCIALQRTETNFKKFVADTNNALKDQTIDMFLGRTKTKEDVYEQFRQTLTDIEQATINNAERNGQPANSGSTQNSSDATKPNAGGTTAVKSDTKQVDKSASVVSPRQKEKQADMDGTGVEDKTSTAGTTKGKLTQAELDTQAIDAEIAAQDHNNNPTEKQKETGIYNKARISLQGHNITLETLKGQQRSGTDSNGKAWAITMNNHYGELDGTTGYDGDAIDVFVGPNPKQGQIFVVDQVTPEGTFDESKVMLGFDTAEQAKAAYMSNYEAGWQGFGSITPAGGNFKQWLYDGKKQRKPYAEYKDTPKAVETKETELEDFSNFVIGEYELKNMIKRSPTPNFEEYQNEAIGRYIHLVKPNETITGRELATRIAQTYDLYVTGNRVDFSAIWYMGDKEIKHTLNGVSVKGKHKGNISTTEIKSEQPKELIGIKSQIQQVIDNYNDAGNMTMNDVINDILSIAYDNDITSIQEAYKTYQDELREDREEFGERGDREAIENKFMGVVEEYLKQSEQPLDAEYKETPEAVEVSDQSVDANEMVEKPEAIEDKKNIKDATNEVIPELYRDKIKATKRKSSLTESEIKEAVNKGYAKPLYLTDRTTETGWYSFSGQDGVIIMDKKGTEIYFQSKDKRSGTDKIIAGTLAHSFAINDYALKNKTDQLPDVGKMIDQSVEVNEMIEKPVEATSAPKYKNGDTVYYQGKRYVINGIYNGVLAYDLETSDGKPAFEEVAESELSTQAPAPRSILDVAVEQVKKNEEKAATNKIDEKEIVETDSKIQNIETQPKITATDEKIGDVGQKIGGAKKDLFNEYAKKLLSVTDQDIASLPLSKSFPRPNFAQLIEDGKMTQETAIFLNYFYDNIPTKPQKKYKIERWVLTVREALNTFNSVLENKPERDLMQEYIDMLNTNIMGQRKAFNAEVYRAVRKAINFPNNDVNVGSLTILRQQTSEGKYVYSVGSPVGNRVRLTGRFDTMEEAASKLIEMAKETAGKPKQIEFSVYSSRSSGDFYITPKGKGEIVLQNGFKTSKEAFEYINENREALTDRFNAMKEIPSERRMSNRDRVGFDYRQGKNVTAEDFGKEFGFRGVEFGNWVNQEERQAHINEAYDALMDLASVIGVTPRALSLNGELGFAFGSRGGGKYAAHYETDKVVINLTKTKGAGTLAHEWFHALDNYLLRAVGNRTSYATEGPGFNKEGKPALRPELNDAFRNLMKVIRKSGFYTRSAKLDKIKGSKYWGTSIELGARGFEDFVMNKLAKSNIQNDYLVNFKSLAEFIDRVNGDISEITSKYPYPTMEESEAISEAYQNLFDTIQEDDNAVLFQAISPIGFYSTVEKALEAINQEKGIKEQFKQMLLKNGAKQAEMDWMGFDELPEKLTKADIQNWIDENRVEVKEVEKTDREKATDREANKYTKYHRFVLPGGENYKELLLTMPEKIERYEITELPSDYEYRKYGEYWGVNKINDLKTAGPFSFLHKTKEEAKKSAIDTLNSIKKRELENKNNFNSSHFDEPNILAHVRFNERTVNGERVLFIEELQSDWQQSGREKGFKGDTTYDAVLEKENVWNVGGVKVLYFERGVDGKNYRTINKDREQVWFKTLDDAVKQANETVSNTSEKEIFKVPNMPFKKTDQWLNLAARRMMRYAAENGFDRIAWTTGEQQADRYDLAKQVDRIVVDEDGGKYTVMARPIGKTDLEEITVATKENLSDYIGKELATKTIEDGGGDFSGNDLKVGGAGMKAFYDAIVPSAMSKLGKPFGAKVESIDIKTLNTNNTTVEISEKGNYRLVDKDNNILSSMTKETGDGFSREDLHNELIYLAKRYPTMNSITSVQSIPVTDSMKETAMAGLPLYHTGTTMQPATNVEVAETVEQLLKTGLAKEVRMVTPEEIAGILEGNEQLATDRAGNEIGDGSWNIEETVFNFEQFPQVTARVDKSATTESTYVTYTNSDNGKSITVRFSNHENNATKFGDQLDGNTATGNQILFHLGLKTREFVPDKYLSIWNRQVAKKDLEQYEQADKTIQELYAMGANADISEYKGKLAKGSNYLILGDTVEELTKTKRNIFGQQVEIGTFNYKDVQFLRTPTGTIYGFVKGGVVYLNSSTPNLNTPIHEFGHLWVDAIEGSDLYNRGAELVKETPYWERVNTDPNYKDLSEAARTKEAMAMAIGDKGESVKRNIGLFARIKVWIADVWTRIGAKFGIQNLTPEQIQNLTFNDFVDVAVSELMSGENLAERNKNTNLATPINNNGSNEQTRLDNRRTMAGEPQRLPLGTLTSSNTVGKTIAGTTTTNTRTGRTADAKSQSEHWNKSKGLKQLAAQAKADGTWIEDISTLTDGKEHFASGTENNVYRSKDGHKVIKVNNLLFLNDNDIEYAYTRDLNYFFDRISAHNTLFPEDAYNIVGFTENEAGHVCIVMEQPYISGNVHPTIEEIETDLAKRGFTKTTLGEGINQGLTGYTNGIYELTDVKPLNVLKDESGNLHYIDLDISKTVLSSTIDVDGIRRPTTNSNGKPIHSTEEGIRNFWRWFGDSKVMDEQGRPLVVYHGTLSNFDTFDLNHTGKGTDSGVWGKGFYFSNDPKYSNTYAERKGITGSIMPVYLSIKNPLITNKDNQGPKIDVPNSTIEDLLNGPENYSRLFREKLIEQGNDGVIAYGDEFVVFYPNQIKSATGNDGSFYPNEPDIRFQVEPEKPEFAGDLGEFAQQMVQYNEQQAENATRTSKMQRLQQIMIEKRALATRHKNGEVSNQEYAKQMLALHEEKQRVMKGLPDPTPEDDGPDDTDPKPTRTPGQSITEYATAVADWNYRQTLAKALAGTSNDITGGLPPVDDDTDINGDMLRLELDQRLGGWFGRLAEGWQDNIRSVRIFLDMLREKGTRVSDYNNFYMQYTALQGKNDAHLKDFGKRFMEAINANVLNIQKYTNYEYRDLENYVFLKHGIERNEYMREAAKAAAEAEGKKFRERDDYSGIYAIAAELWAKKNGIAFNPKKKGEVEKIQADPDFVKVRDAVITEYIAQFEKTISETIIPGHAKGEQLTIAGFWSAINAATNYSLDRLVSSGIENKAEVDDLKARYQYYVPLRGHEVEAEKVWQYEAPDNKNVVSKAIMQASGRASRAEHPFAYIIQMAQTSINKANRNQLNQTILRLARLDKSGLMSVSETWYVLTGTDPDSGKEIWTETEPDFSEDHEIRAGEIRAWNEKMKKLEEEGKARRFKKGLRIGGLFIKPKQKRQHAITIFEDGVAYQVYINGNPRVSQAINELNEKRTEIPIIPQLTRFCASMTTSRSPQFMLTNGARDLVFASSILPSKEGARYTGQFLKNYPVAMAILANNATFDFGNDKARYKKYLKEFEMNGGETGYTHLLELQDIQKELYKKQKGKNYLNPKTDIDVIISVVDAGNKVIENSTRLAVYITSRENGRSIERAVSDSKEVTLNFNRRGSGVMGASFVKSFFMFVNAGVQALANFGHVYKMHPAKMSATIGAYAAVGFILPMIINMIGGEDDEKEYMNMTDWERQNNLCLPTGNGVAKIPLPQEMRVFFKLGDEVYKLYSGRTEASETAMATLLSAVDMIPISPLGTIAAGEVDDFGDLQRAISPDALRTVAEIATNTNFMGGQIYDKYKAEKEGLPGYQKARLNRVGEPRAPESIVAFTKWLDHLTGGNGVEKGRISWNPDIVNHIAKSYLNGVYGIISEGGKSFTKRFYTSNADIEEKNTTVKDYYKRIREAEEVLRQDKGYWEQVEKGEISEDTYNKKIPPALLEKAYTIHDYGNTITKIERILKTGELTADDELYYKHMSDSLKQEVIRIK